VLVNNVESGKRGKKLLMKLLPESGVVLATAHFEGSKCTILETKITGQLAGEVLTDPGGEPIELGEAKSWSVNFPKIPIKEVWLVKGGKGGISKLSELTAFSEPAILEGQALMSLANEKHEIEETKWSFNDTKREAPSLKRSPETCPFSATVKTCNVTFTNLLTMVIQKVGKVVGSDSEAFYKKKTENCVVGLLLEEFGTGKESCTDEIELKNTPARGSVYYYCMTASVGFICAGLKFE
jgi:hypothetical protein